MPSRGGGWRQSPARRRREALALVVAGHADGPGGANPVGVADVDLADLVVPAVGDVEGVDPVFLGHEDRLRSVEGDVLGQTVGVVGVGVHLPAVFLPAGPPCPAMVEMMPLVSTMRMAQLPLSAMKTLPAESTATPWVPTGMRSWPGHRHRQSPRDSGGRAVGILGGGCAGNQVDDATGVDPADHLIQGIGDVDVAVGPEPETRGL